VKRKFVAVVAGCLLAVGGYQSSARALGFPPLPPIIPDICVFTCITWTHSTLLLDIEQYYAMVQNLSNVHDLAGLYGEAVAVAGLIQVDQAAPPMEQSDDAAAAAIFKAKEDAAKQQWMEGQGAAADGNQQQQQIENGHLAAIDSNTSETNLLWSTQVSQQKARDQDAIANYLDEFGPTSTVGSGSDI
jgi:hypothetical protein